MPQDIVEQIQAIQRQLGLLAAGQIADLTRDREALRDMLAAMTYALAECVDLAGNSMADSYVVRRANQVLKDTQR